ncbi:hypothetical protein FBALC1_08823 [Flavobacteriales bacterium ALC-1]|nr:hypothetical protein FBALC1_08823 [Flavobacteriales bacterium ALC-1]
MSKLEALLKASGTPYIDHCITKKEAAYILQPLLIRLPAFFNFCNHRIS